MTMVVIHAEERGEMMYVVVHSEERGDMMTYDRSDMITEDRGDMMMMVVVPNHLLTTIE